MDPVEPWIDGDAVRRLAAQLLSSSNGSEIGDSPDAGFGPGFEGFTSGVAETEIRPAALGATHDRRSPPVSGSDSPVELPASLSAPVPTAVPTVEVPASSAVPVPIPRAESPAEAPTPSSVPAAEARLEKPGEASPDREESEAKPFLAAATVAAIPSTPIEDPGDHPFRNVSRPATEADGDIRRGPLMERMLRFRDWLRRHAEARSVFVLDREGQPVLDDPAYAKLHFLARSLSQAYRPVPGQPGNVHVKVGSDAFLVVIPVETAFGCLVLGTVLPRPLDASSVEIVAKALADAAKPGNS